MEARGPSCKEVRRLAERFLEGAFDGVDEEALRKHLAGCPACRAEYALDFALVKALKASPEEAFESVSSEVLGRVRVRERKSWVLGWGFAVAGIAGVGVLMNSFGLRVFHYVLDIVSGGLAARPELAAGSRVVSELRLLADGLRVKLFDCSVGGTLCPYRALILSVVIGSAALAIFMMYLMGLWLRKPREVRS